MWRGFVSRKAMADRELSSLVRRSDLQDNELTSHFSEPSTCCRFPAYPSFADIL